MTFRGYYDTARFRYINSDLLKLVSRKGHQKIPKTGSFYGDDINFYIDSSDGVNDDLNIQEYCGRMLNVIQECAGKRFLFFKCAHSPAWSKSISQLAEENNGKVIPFFKWGFNDAFYQNIFNKREEIVSKFSSQKKEYDIGYFSGTKPYKYPKPSRHNPLISHSDHGKFSLTGSSPNTGEYINESRNDLLDKINNSKFKILHTTANYLDYIKESFKCKVILNPPGIGEYTSRMFDQSYLGNCIVLRKNTYDNGLSWKNHFPELDFYSDNWEDEMENILNNHEEYGAKCQNYFDSCWTSKAIVNYLKNELLKHK